MMIHLLDKSAKISQIAAWCSGLLLFLASIMIAVEVVLRKVFTLSIGGADELSSYALAISCTWGFSYALFRKSHIRIDVLHCRMPGKVRAFLDLLAYGLLAIYIFTLSYFAFLVVKTSVIKHSAADAALDPANVVAPWAFLVRVDDFCHSCSDLLLPPGWCPTGSIKNFRYFNAG